MIVEHSFHFDVEIVRIRCTVFELCMSGNRDGGSVSHDCVARANVYNIQCTIYVYNIQLLGVKIINEDDHVARGYHVLGSSHCSWTNSVLQCVHESRLRCTS